MYNGRLDRFASENLVIHYSDAEKSAIDRSIGEILSCLKLHLSTEIDGVVKYGSYMRGTMLPRKFDASSDVDVLVVFKRQYSEYHFDTLRDHIRDALDQHYSKSEVYKDYPSVTLEMNHLKFDLNPATAADYPVGHYKLLCREDWIYTNPKELDLKVENANRLVPNNVLRKVIRLCKYWNKGYGKGAMTTYELEKFICENLPFRGFSSLRTYDGFLEMVEQICLIRREYWNSPALNMVRDIRHANQEEDSLGQKWRLNRLLPGVVE